MKQKKLKIEDRGEILSALLSVEKSLNEDFKELCDSFHNLELSYNRSKKLLRMSKFFLEQLNFYACPVDLWEKAEYLHRRLTLELDGLEDYKGLKGGTRCV